MPYNDGQFEDFDKCMKEHLDNLEEDGEGA